MIGISCPLSFPTFQEEYSSRNRKTQVAERFRLVSTFLMFLVSAGRKNGALASLSAMLNVYFWMWLWVKANCPFKVGAPPILEPILVRIGMCTGGAGF